MLDINCDNFSLADIKHRLKHSELILAKAKQRSLEIELSFNELVEIVLIFIFTKGDLLENKTTPEILLRTV